MALTDNLISWFDLEEASGTRNDALGANNLTDNNTVTSGSGKVGTGAIFTGANSEDLSKASPTGTMAGDNPLTVAFWFKPSVAYLGVQGMTMASLVSGSAGNWQIRVSNVQVLTMRIWAGAAFGTQVDASIASAFAVNTWAFVVAWHDPVANEIGIQLDNGTPTTTSHSTGMYSVAQSLWLGSAGSNGEYTDGMLDSVGIYARVLSSGERTSLYNAGAGLAFSDLGGSVTHHRMLTGAGAFAPVLPVLGPALWRKYRMDRMADERRIAAARKRGWK